MPALSPSSVGCMWCGCSCCCWSAYCLFMTFLVLPCISSVLCLVLGLLSWCTARCACVSPVLSCVWCCVSLAGVLHFVLVSVLFCFVSCPFSFCFWGFVLYCVGVWGWEFLNSGRQGSIPWQSWQAGSVWGCSPP